MIDTERVDYLIKLIKNNLQDSYLLSFSNKTHVVIFRPEKVCDVVGLLENKCACHAGICYYFFGFSVALWEDIFDVIGFRGEQVCCVEIFEGSEINKDFYWRYKENVVGRIKK